MNPLASAVLRWLPFSAALLFNSLAHAEPAWTPIPVIQGRGDASLLVDQRVTTRGVVTAVFPKLGGFFLQDETGDGDDRTSDGIFVFARRSVSVAPGDRIQLEAMVTEYHSVTELVEPANLQVLGRGVRMEPRSIRLPVKTAGELERYEGMLVRIESELTVSQNYFQGRYGQVTLAAGGRLFEPASLYPSHSAEARALAELNARSRIILDDGSTAQNPDPIPFLGKDGTLRAGDVVHGIVGVMDFGPSTSDTKGPREYRIHPVEPPVFLRMNQRSATPPNVGGNVRVASFNVQNYFTTLDQEGSLCASGNRRSDCRGAKTAEEWSRQRDKLVAALDAMNADVIGLVELQNNGDETMQSLVDALNVRLGAGTYAVVPQPAGGVGSDAIRVGMIYRPGRLKRVGESLSDPHVMNGRAPMAQTFALADGTRFSVIVNHWKSKRCDGAAGEDEDAQDGQGCWNGRRLSQARRLLAFVQRIKSAGGNDVLVVGDFNANTWEDPMRALYDGGLADVVGRFDPHPYSYVFDGQAESIDHVLATPSLAAKVSGAAVWHINADEPAVLNYQIGRKARDLYAPTPYRSSDHDPLVVGLKLGK